MALAHAGILPLPLDGEGRLAPFLSTASTCIVECDLGAQAVAAAVGQLAFAHMAEFGFLCDSLSESLL
jgi:hypothetical protein